MELIVDANILFSFFRENPVRVVIVNSKSFDLELISPEYSLEELMQNISSLAKYSKLSPEQIKEAIKDLREFIATVPSEEYGEFESEAKQISPHDKDAPYFALALKMNCGIWSNEPGLKKQSKIRVLNTKELLNLLEESKSS